MPGIFGVVGVPSGIRTSLEEAFRRRWADVEVIGSMAGLVGGHAFGNHLAVHRTGSGDVVAVDGERSVYAEVQTVLADPNIDISADGKALTSVGNIAFVGTDPLRVRVAADPTGTFPLYYLETNGGFIFSSLLRPLGRAVGARRDDLAVLEFVLNGYTVGGRTIFEGIRRLLPGQSVTYAGGGARVTEQSTAWVGREDTGRADAAERSWRDLSRAVRRGLAVDSAALMLSAGWDSRTLLAAATATDIPLRCFSHGDTAGRELRIAQSLARSVQVPCHLELIDDRVLEPGLLERGFHRTENVVFPHWHRAGRVLAEQGVDAVAAGVFGEILGGHYGPAMASRGVRKLWAVAGPLLGASVGSHGTRIAPRDLLRVNRLSAQWYMRQDYQNGIPDARSRLNAAVDTAFDRLEDRGVDEDVALVEAFISEHRGTQYINAQLLSCRSFIDVALPFAGGELFTYSTRIPLEAKIHNALNREILGRNAPGLLRQPMAATLVPARWPLLIQEGSRAVRKAYESGRNTLSRRTGGAISRPRLGWVDFAFLRDGRALHRLCDDLRCDFWDRESIRRRIDSFRATPDPARYHPVYDQLCKVYTVDLMLRDGPESMAQPNG